MIRPELPGRRRPRPGEDPARSRPGARKPGRPARCFADRRATLAAKVEEEADQLEELLLRLAPPEEGQPEPAGLEGRHGIDDAVEKNRRCADLLFGLYRLAGLDFHAERLRPKARRRRPEEPEKAKPPAAPPPLAMSVN